MLQYDCDYIGNFLGWAELRVGDHEQGAEEDASQQQNLQNGSQVLQHWCCNTAHRLLQLMACAGAEPAGGVVVCWRSLIPASPTA